MNDSYGRELNYLRISVTDRCNFRCVYCMPQEGVTFIPHERIMTFEDIDFLLNVLIPMGIKKVRFTGGEPLVRKGVTEFLKKLKQKRPQLKIALTTNGSLVKFFVEEIRDIGLSGLNISLDTINKDKFKDITRVNEFENVVEGIDIIGKALRVPLKINTVVIKGFNDDEIEDLIEFARKKNAVIRFIEFMPLDESVWSMDNFLPADEILSRLPGGLEVWEKEETSASHSMNGPAVYYKNIYTGQRIGIIAAVSNHFCDKCNRLRVTANGELRTCLFAPKGKNILPLLRARDKETLEETIRSEVRMKPKGWMFLANTQKHMWQIGG
ncbi:GTP 3',8-cyclase MoaA [Thermovirga sp.]|uniref:GTP 3',8-cyclase MoaA n=1 Tax=Thermovirga sp. TaxID=2699834 RepID=UPI0025F6CB33|nr:GTP 3',8-cyclase MoaA [Thermovirga sp.]MBO8153112.1 GTP 3',8-cyclase MoaA [Thermovirga sp.]